MVRDKFSFSSDGNFIKPPDKSIDTVLEDTRRVDDALLHALSLVLASNTEYARSVSALLETDMTREQTFNEMNSRSKELLEKTQQLIEHQEKLRELLDNISDENRALMEIVIKDHLDTQQQYMDSKFKALFKHHGLTENGTPTWLGRLRNVFTHEFSLLVLGAILYHIIVFILKYFGVK